MSLQGANMVLVAVVGGPIGRRRNDIRHIGENDATLNPEHVEIIEVGGIVEQDLCGKTFEGELDYIRGFE
jgi:hypothetical protein